MGEPFVNWTRNKVWWSSLSGLQRKERLKLIFIDMFICKGIGKASYTMTLSSAATFSMLTTLET